MKQIVPGLYWLSGMKVGRVYAIEDTDGITLIDAGVTASAASILKEIQAFSKPVKRILITHAHPDHIGGLPKVQAATGADVIAYSVEKPVVEGKEPIGGKTTGLRMPETTMPGTPVNRTLSDGEVISEVFGGLHVLSTPGHSAGHVCYWQPEKRVLFTGDTMMHLFNRMTLPFSIVTPDMAENKRSIAKLVKLEAAVVCFGHGDPLTQGATETVRNFAKRVGAIAG